MSLRLPPWESLSQDEQIPISNLPLDKNYLITGGPGTGKTILALYRASRLKAAYDDKKKVMFLVYNKTLRKYIEQAISEIELDQSSVANWHSWFYGKYYQQFKKTVPEVDKFSPDWEVILPQWPTGHLFDHLILDESQDLPVGLLQLLKKISNNFTIFADDNQSITDNGSNIAQISNAFQLFDRRYPLTKNYRNTKKISQISNLFYTGDPANIPAHTTKEGDSKPTVFYVNDYMDYINYIANFADNNPEQNIGVFVPTKGKLKSIYDDLKNKKTKARIQHYNSSTPDDNFNFVEDGVKVITYHSAKGLEFDTVFIPEIDSKHYDTVDNSKLNKMYVCCSRTKENLFFTYSNKNSPSFALSKFKENDSLLEWKDLGETQLEATF